MNIDLWPAMKLKSSGKGLQVTFIEDPVYNFQRVRFWNSFYTLKTLRQMRKFILYFRPTGDAKRAYKKVWILKVKEKHCFQLYSMIDTWIKEI